MTNNTGQPLDGQLNLDLSENFAGEDADRFHFLGFNGSINNKLEDIKSGGLKEPKTYTGKVEWAGLDEGYFMTAIIPESAKSWVTLSEPPKAPMVASVRTPVEALGAGQAAQFSYVLYFGPKNLDDLKPLGLDRAVNFGWFDFLGKPLLTFLNWLERYSFNYGWAIVILTILLRIVFWYPNHKSYKSMKDMQKLQPKVAKLREKYKDDKETMNKELMALYRTFKVNPMAGCLPMVMQLPVFIALYNVLGVCHRTAPCLLYPHPAVYQHRLAGGPVRQGPLAHHPHRHGGHHVPPAKNDAIHRRSHPGQDDDVLALDFYVYVLELRLRSGSLLAGEQRSVNRPAALYQ